MNAGLFSDSATLGCNLKSFTNEELRRARELFVKGRALAANR